MDGTAFYRNDGEGGNLVYSIGPTWGGLRISVYTHREAKDFNKQIVDEAWRHATENNPLKGEAFSLGGEFVKKTSETWEDIFIEEKNSKALTRVVDRINARGKDTPNRGVILMGPPGTGKTLSGRIVRNTLKDCSFIWVSSRDIGYGGFSHAFDLAREIAPSVLFFEDIDNWVGANIDLLKTELDGIARSTGVVTIMTTNFPERLPEALLDRPGRFHDVLNFDLPTDLKRAAMLRKWVEGLLEADVENAVKKTKGYSGAHMYELASFTRNLMEADDLSASDALSEALKKVEEQKELITKVQLQGSNYRLPRRAKVRDEQNAGNMAAMQTPSPSPSDADVQMWKDYFERKQPANKASTKVLKRFFQLHGEEQPDNEARAWERMGELIGGETAVEAEPGSDELDETTETVITPSAEQPAPEVPPTEEKPKEAEPAPANPEPVNEEPKEETTAEPVKVEVEEVTTPQPTPEPAPEAPEPARTASVQIPMSDLMALPKKIADVRNDALVTASRQGVPRSEWAAFAEAAVRQYLASLSQSLTHEPHRNR